MSIQKHIDNLKLWYRHKSAAKTISLSPERLLELRFFQFKTSTCDFFYSKKSKTDIRVIDTPHYAYAKQLANNLSDNEGKLYYRDYIRASWVTNDQEKLDAQLNQFEQHFQAFKDHKSRQRPVLTQLTENGEYFVVDGNHRTSYSAALNQDIVCTVIPFDLAVRKYCYSKHFYGQGYKNIPYQSVYLNQEIVLSGRRQDTIQRLQMIPDYVLKGQRVLDIASNFGMSSILAKQLGASSCYGIEYADDIASYANRYAMFNGVYPDVSFRQFNIDTDKLDENFSADTAFIFSIYDHLKTPRKLIELTENHVDKYVVFESHPHGKRENYADYFNSGLFSEVNEIGRLKASSSDSRTESDRILWLCIRK